MTVRSSTDTSRLRSRTMSMLDHALDLVAQGHEVFPLNGKIPAIAGGHSCLDASRDPRVVRELWRLHPEANIGIHVAVDELVVDVDPRHGGDVLLAALEASHAAMPETQTSMSGRDDGGKHLFYTHPGGPVTASHLPGIDLKKRRGYVVAPPSLHPDTQLPYRWVDTRPPAPLPEWFITLIRPAPLPSYRRVGYPGRPGKRLEALVQFVLDSKEGERNTRLFWAACRGCEMVLTGQMDAAVVTTVMQQAAEAIGLGRCEAALTISSAFAPGRIAA